MNIVLLNNINIKYFFLKIYIIQYSLSFNSYPRKKENFFLFALKF